MNNNPQKQKTAVGLPTYNEHFKEYLTIKGYTTDTAEGFCNMVSRFMQWLQGDNIPVDAVSYNDILAYVDFKRKEGILAATLQKNINVLRHFYNFMQAEYQLMENPASNVNIKGIKRRSFYEILSPEQLRSLYTGFNLNPTSLNSARNRIVLGLVVFQGIRTEELARLNLSDLNLQDGTVHIRETSRTGERILQLEPLQVYALLDYLNNTRKALLVKYGEGYKDEERLFIARQAYHYTNMVQAILKQVRQKYPFVKNADQLRASVITNWLKLHNLRQVQIMAGHKYISSTEKYKANNIDALKEDINKYHPLL